MNRKVSTVRPSAIEIGMPVSISAISRPKMKARAHRATSFGDGRRVIDALDLAGIVVRQLAGPPESPGDLQEAEAHQIGAERDAEKTIQRGISESGETWSVAIKLDDELRAHGADHGGEQRAAEQAEQHHLSARLGVELVDQHVDADMDAGAHAVGGAELRHPHEHVDAQFLRPGRCESGYRNG